MIRADIIFLSVLMIASSTHAVVLPVWKQLSLYESVFLDLAHLKLTGQENTKHIKGLSPLVSHGYEYAASELLKANISPEAEEFKLLHQFREESKQTISQRKLTLNRFKRIAAQIAYLLASYQKKAEYLLGCHNELSLMTSGRWKHIDDPFWEQCSLLKVPAAPFCFEAIVFADQKDVTPPDYVHAFVAAPQYWITVISPTASKFGGISRDPLSAFLMSSNHYRLYAQDYRDHLKKRDALTGLVKRLSTHPGCTSDLDHLCLFMMIRDFMISAADVQEGMTQKDLLEVWTTSAQKRITSLAQIRGRFCQRLLDTKAYSVSLSSGKILNFIYKIRQFTTLPNSTYALRVDLMIQDDTGEYFSLYTIPLEISSILEDIKGFEEYIVLQLSTPSHCFTEQDQKREVMKAIYKLSDEEKLVLEQMMGDHLHQLWGTSLISVNFKKTFGNLFGGYAQAVNNKLAYELVPLDEPRVAVDALKNFFLVFYNTYGPRLS